MDLETPENRRPVRDDLRYLSLLAAQYPTVDAASTEIINLQAILNLPKGTEHFLTDIHGENEPFDHVLRNASGVIKSEIESLFGNTLAQTEKKRLATLIYYPEQKLERLLRQEPNLAGIDDWYKITLYRLIEICRSFSSKYTRSKVRKAMPRNFTYILEELLNTDYNKPDKTGYYREIIRTIIDIGRAREFIVALSKLIQCLAIDRLHIIGDIYDRGPGADRILDTLLDYHSVDIQWGNHDILWMGAFCGSAVCIANAVRICTRYANLDFLENSYGINLLPLATFALEQYGGDPCAVFLPRPGECKRSAQELQLIAKMHKAVTVIQLKLEKRVIDRRPSFCMEDRLFLDKIDFTNKTVEAGGRTRELTDPLLPTVNPKDPYALTPREAEVMDRLVASFRSSEKLARHVRFLFSRGSLYLTCNSNLLYHGCIPLNEDGSFFEMNYHGATYSGKAYLDLIERTVRKGVMAESGTPEHQEALDWMWYLWCGKHSPLFGKSPMATFEDYFCKGAKPEEKKDPYYHYRDREDVCRRILSEFGVNPENGHIVNGHVPVERVHGENPIKANGKLISIDGGFSRAYRDVTGIAGYTLISDSFGLTLVSHEPFISTEAAIENETDIHSSTQVLERSDQRIKVRDTDIGGVLANQICDLKNLLAAYRSGLLKEQLPSG